MSTLAMEFKPSTVVPGEQAEITRLCNIAWKHPALTSSNVATVYSAGGRWWHTNPNDPKEHITVRYNRRVNRVHVYRDGTVNVSPQKPPKGRVGLDVGVDVAGLDADLDLGDGYDTVPEIEGEEWDD